MGKRRNELENVYDSIRVVRQPEHVYTPPATDVELNEVETQAGSRLPHSFREFMKRFGPGAVQGWACLYPITARRKAGRQWTVTGRTSFLRDYYRKHPHLNHEWLANLIYFANDGGGSEFAWDPAAVTNARPHECRFYYLPRHTEDRPVSAGDTFAEFVEWVKARVQSWREPERLEEDGPGVYFCLGYLRTKKAPLKRDVRRWLSWNGSTILAMAQSIREGQTDALPILADALEEAGCANVDLLTSCRAGDPTIDGLWALQVLLGKPSDEAEPDTAPDPAT